MIKYLLLLASFLLWVDSSEAGQVTSKNGSANLPDGVIDYVWPSYPYLARLNEFDCQGFFRLNIDAGSGKVSSVDIVKTTTHKILDDAASTAFRKWLFQPHSAKAVIVPVTFAVVGRRLSEARRLAVDALDPERPVTSHRGTGVYRFLVDYETDTVTDVWIIRSTGRLSFDQAVVKAYRQWKFLPHKIRSIDTTVGFGL